MKTRILLVIIFFIFGMGCDRPDDDVVGVLPPYNGGAQTCSGPCAAVDAGPDAGLTTDVDAGR
jgi:hypothetical protein